MAMQLRDINSVSIKLASPDRIKGWSHGEIKKPETINYRTLKPEKDGLFCERIFGPTRDWECYCGKYKKSRYRGVICDKCGVEVTVSKVRRERLGHITLSSPVCHIWYVKGIPGRISALLNIKSKDLEKVVYYISFIITEVDKERIRDLMPLLKEAVDLEVQERVTIDPQVQAESKLDIAEIVADLLSEGWLASKQVSLEGHKKPLVKKGDKYSAETIRELILNNIYKIPVADPAGKDHSLDLTEMASEFIKDKEPTESIIDPLSGEVLAARGVELGQESFTKLFQAGICTLNVLDRQQMMILESRSRENEKRLEEIRAALDLLLEIQPKGLLSESEYRRLTLLGDVIEDRLGVKMDTFFRAQMGAEAVKYLLGKVDLGNGAHELRKLIDESTSRAKRVKYIKRLSIIRAFLRSGNKPEWMILDVLPVIPPELRPMVQLEGGRFAASDLNDLYRRVINRNSRLKRLIDIKAPESLIRNEKRMLQEAVDALIDNGRRGKVVTGSNNRPLKSLSDLLKGKQGRFRQNLLGKRVDYSGRSVIVVGPELKLHQCGIPKIMALEFFKPFVLKQIVDRGYAPQIKNAKTLVEQLDPRVWDVLEQVIKGNPVLLNRAPTLHRLGIQAFEPVLIEGKAIQIHPLVCQAFNADFDGDQMAVHLPLSLAAQAEARTLMLSSNNLLKPADGKPIVGPTQDMIMGIYYMTVDLDNKPVIPYEDIQKPKAKKLREDRKTKYFPNEDDLITTYELGMIDLHDPVMVRLTKNSVIESFPFRRIVVTNKIIETTCGRILFNQLLPTDLPYFNMTLEKKTIGTIVANLYKTHGNHVTVETLDKIKSRSFWFATQAGLTIAIGDVTIPPDKQSIIDATDRKVLELEKLYDQGKIDDTQLYEERIGLWTTATNQVTDALFSHLNKMNPIALMANSGARGNKQQVRQLAGMRGLMADPSGRIMELPIKSNFREGLTVLEYFISTHGARKGLADTALRTADSGYLTRRLVDVAQDVIVIEHDCGTSNFMEVKPNVSGRKVIQALGERVLGRVAAQDVIDEETGEIIVRTGEMIEEEAVEKIDSLKLSTLKVRSVLTCQTHRGVCQKCYGRDLGTNRLVEIGTPIGIIAAQSIGEPGTQLTMRTFHTGGVAGKGQQDITQGLPMVELLFELFEARYQKEGAIIAPASGTIEINEEPFVLRISTKSVSAKELKDPKSKKRKDTTFTVEDLIGKKLLVAQGEKVKKGEAITQGMVNPRRVLALQGIRECQRFLVDEVQSVYKNQGVDTNDKHIEVIVRQMLRFVKITDPGDSDLLRGDLVDSGRFERVHYQFKRGKKRPPKAEPVLLGISKASLSTESFLSTASFQETTKVLTNAAVEGKTDYLRGLKENVIIGRLVPVGTGQDKFHSLMINLSKIHSGIEPEDIEIPDIAMDQDIDDEILDDEEVEEEVEE
jgi:DNA-directed RNA polymerase subunit beta'